MKGVTMRRITILLLIAVAFFAALPVFGQTSLIPAKSIEKPFSWTTTRWLGTGGPHIAMADDYSSLFFNPAGLKDAKQLSVLEINVGAYGPIFELLGIVVGNDKLDIDFGDPATIGALANRLGTIAGKWDGKIPLGLDVRGPLAFAFVKNGFGIGVFDRVYMDSKIVGTTLKANLNADVILNGGYAGRLLNTDLLTLDLGGVLEIGARGAFPLNVGVSNLLGGGDLSNIIDFDKLTIKAGFSLDLGARLVLFKSLAVGLSVNDLISYGVQAYPELDWDKSYSIAPTINLGVSYTFAPAALKKIVNFSAMADYRDIVNLFNSKYNTRNPWLNLGIGVEAEFFNFLNIRVGMSDLLPSLGIGFDCKVLQIETAIYGKELGNDPGQLSTYAVDVGLLFHY
jgi:hypothetical protein